MKSFHFVLVYAKIAIKVIILVFGHFFVKYVGGILFTARNGRNVPSAHIYLCYNLFLSTSAIGCSCLPLPASVPVYLCCCLYSTGSVYLCIYLYLASSAVLCICIPPLSFVPVFLCSRLFLSTVPLMSSVLVYLCSCLYLSSSAVICACLALLLSVPFFHLSVVCTCLALL